MSALLIEVGIAATWPTLQLGALIALGLLYRVDRKERAR